MEQELMHGLVSEAARAQIDPLLFAHQARKFATGREELVGSEAGILPGALQEDGEGHWPCAGAGHNRAHI